MSDSEDSTVTYTEVSSLFENLSDIGSLGVDGLPIMTHDPYAYVVAALQAPPSSDYVLGPENPPSPAYVPEFVSEPVYPKFMPPEDDVLPAEEQPLLVAVSLTADSLGYIHEFDPEEDDEDPEEDPADYPTDEEDDEEEESSGDDVDDEEEHPAPADSIPPPATHRTSPLLPIPLPTSSPSLLLPSTSRIAYVLEVTLPPRKRLCITLGPIFEVVESSSALTARPTGGIRADYGFFGTFDDEIRQDPERGRILTRLPPRKRLHYRLGRELSAAKHKLMLLDTVAERRLMLLSQVKTVNEKCCC
uniref:Uncharacterized protein n=1 Tax=Tanacetum cinerariifolium TaxID=118510 RepID=A0A699K326_TANCI|nr:hypothetical protein [Tanacetum cinerariifolium]